MELGVIAVVTLLLALFAYWFANTYFKAKISQELMNNGAPYEKGGEDHTKTLLVLGDSTGVGVGAEKPEDTVAGRLADYIHATYVENRSMIGAAVADVSAQITGATLPRYDVILMQIGGNDIISFGNAKVAAEKLSEAIGMLPNHEKLIIMSAGNVGGATIFPPFIRPFHTARTLQFHKEFDRVAHGWNALYVNLYEPFYKDPFLRDPRRYLSRDGLHPSSYGYGTWFDKTRAALEKS